MYLRAILCTFQISVDFYYVPVGGRGGHERAQMALASLRSLPFQSPKKSQFLGLPPPPPEMALVMDSPPLKTTTYGTI
jgi:hypothetical protein